MFVLNHPIFGLADKKTSYPFRLSFVAVLLAPTLASGADDVYEVM
jgi:hypothetical protein